MNIIKTHTIINNNLHKLNDEFLSPKVLAFCMPESLIEWAARLCYVSNDKFGTTNKFIPGLIKAGHLDVLEHVSLTAELEFNLIDPEYRYYWYYQIKNQYPFLNIKFSGQTALIWGNIRVWKEIADNFFVDFDEIFSGQDICDLWFYLSFIAPNVFDMPRFEREYSKEKFQDYYSRAQARYLEILQHSQTFNFASDKNTDTGAKVTLLGWTPVSYKEPYYHATFQYDNVSRSLTHQLVRHRLMSFSQQSQRYCDAKNSRFVFPLENNSTVHYNDYENHFHESMLLYDELRRDGVKKEDARAILPNNIATHIVTSGFSNGWEHYFKLRCAKDAQREIRLVAEVTQELYRQYGVS